jgi:hypothetical protein
MNFVTQSRFHARAVLVIRRPAVARGVAAVAALLVAVGLAACSSSGSPSAGGTHSATGSGASSFSPSAPPSAGSATPTGGTSKGARGAKSKGNAIPGLILFKGTLRLTGAETRHMSFTAFPGVTRPASSCTRLAAGGTPVPSGSKPAFGIPAPAPGNPVYFTGTVSPYHGPGTYGKNSIVGVGASFIVGDTAYNPLAATATATVTFRADGSGIFTFRNATSVTGTISGSIRWTCSD